MLWISLCFLPILFYQRSRSPVSWQPAHDFWCLFKLFLKRQYDLPVIHLRPRSCYLQERQSGCVAVLWTVVLRDNAGCHRVFLGIRASASANGAQNGVVMKNSPRPISIELYSSSSCGLSSAAEDHTSSVIRIATAINIIVHLVDITCSFSLFEFWVTESLNVYAVTAQERPIVAQHFLWCWLSTF